MSLRIKKSKRTYKVQQVVWLDAESFAWAVAEANKLGIAPNVFIAEVVKKAREFVESGEWTPIRVEQAVKVEEKILYCCPACEKVFEDIKWLRKHLEVDKEHLLSWLGGERAP